jgi:Ca-activated chloride channel family protein
MTSAEHNYDDAQLTAYVLGELGADEAAAIERRMESDDALRREIESIRETTNLLHAEFAGEAAPGLTESQRETIAAGANRRDPVLFRIRPKWAGLGFAAAACLALAIIAPMMFQRANTDEYAIGDAAEQPANAPHELERQRRREVASAKDDAIDRGLRDAAEQLRFGVEERGKSSGSSPAYAGQRGGQAAGKAGLGGGGRAGGSVDGYVGTQTATGDRVQSEAPAMQRPPAPAMEPDLSPAPPPARLGESRSRGRPGVADELAEEADEDLVQLGVAMDRRDFNREAYGRLVDNPFKISLDEPLSTFSVDVDTASYANIRRFINDGMLPPPVAVRIEEMINYFDYQYEPASGEHPFSVNVDVNAAPWKPDHRLVRIGLRGEDVDIDMRPATSLVFLLDVSGSMNQANKLPLVKESMKLLVDRLNADDRVAIVVYAGASGVVLPSTYCDEEEKILAALDQLHAGGSTAGAAGIQLAYQVAEENFIKGGVNRVILCTDGDFNVGVSSEGELIRLIEEKRESGVFLSILGFGTGNWQDQKMEMLSNHGNGNFAYIDSIDEAKRSLVDRLSGTLVTIAKDVKVQVEFNPAKVGAYRLIGYANRLLAAQDFNDDTKDAGEIGAGHTVTALYEIIPPELVGEQFGEQSEVDDLKYQKPREDSELTGSDELLTVKLRYKQPDGDESTLIEKPVVDDGAGLNDASGDFQFAAAVAGFGMLLRDSAYTGDATFETMLDLAAAGLEHDPDGRRAEFIELVERAKMLASPPPADDEE